MPLSRHERGAVLTDVSRDSVAAAIDGFDRIPLPVGTARAAAVAVTVVEDDTGLGVLLTKRAERMRAHPGQWALPGGRLDADETAADAAIREMDEELGLLVGADAVLGRLDDYPTRSGYVITPVVVWAGRIGPLRPNRDEVASAHVARFDDLDVEPRFVTIPESSAPVIQLPLFDTLIHAPTAAVLYQFREVALRRRATRVAHLEQPVFAWR